MKNLDKLGFGQWFKNQIDPTKEYDFDITRVITVNKNSYIVSNGKKDIYAELTGKFLFNSGSALDFPAVGDWVYVQLFDDESLAIIHEKFQRKSLLKRKAPGKKIEYQLIASNIDTAIIMQSLDFNYNLRRLERYLVMVNEGGIKPVVLLSKSDLVSPAEIEEKKTEIRKLIPGIQIEAFSNNDVSDIETIRKMFTPCKTFCLLGSSGVGKTTLLNNLVKEDLFNTREIREKDGRGRHTTTRRELIFLENGSMIIDNPGMRELGMISLESGLDDTFTEIANLEGECQFNDCTHTTEKGCAILKALEEGTITKERFQNYLKMKKESLFHGLSYYEKRQKDKLMGKYIRSVLKHKKDKRL